MKHRTPEEMKSIKRCPKCDRWLPVDSFTVAVNRYDGRKAFCKSCWAAYNRDYARRSEKKRSPRTNANNVLRRNLDRLRAVQVRELSRMIKRWNRSCRTCGACIVGSIRVCPKCRKENQARAWKNKPSSKTPASKHRERIRLRWRYKTDPMENLHRKISSGIKHRLKLTGRGKRTFAMLGYTAEQLYDRLMSTMPDGYSWQDFMEGRLHIDHVRPASLFTYESCDDLQFKVCWALDNLQLLPWRDNILKSNRWIDPMMIAA